MGEEEWIAAEAWMAVTARRVFARARRRWRRVVAVALVATAAAVTYRALAPPTYRGAVYFVLSESDLVDPTIAPRPPRDVRQYIASVALSRQHLETIMRRYGVSVAWLDRDPVSAVDDFREEIGIEVARNYFVEDRRRRDEPRSAFVTISVLGHDPETTRAIVHDIGEAIRRDQSAGRSGTLADVHALLDAELAQARARTHSLQEEIARVAVEARRANGPGALALRGRIVALELETGAAVDRVLALEQRADATAFHGSAEDERLGVSLRLLDEHVDTVDARLSTAELAVRALAAFAAAALLAAVVIGAFDDRVYEPEDLAERGIPLLGALSRFPGDEAAAYVARAAAPNAGAGA